MKKKKKATFNPDPGSAFVYSSIQITDNNREARVNHRQKTITGHSRVIGYLEKKAFFNCILFLLRNVHIKGKLISQKY